LCYRDAFWSSCLAFHGSSKELYFCANKIAYDFPQAILLAQMIGVILSPEPACRQAGASEGRRISFLEEILRRYRSSG